MSPAQAALQTSTEDGLKHLIPNTNSLPIITKGEAAVVQDEEGKSYIDLEAGPGVASVGHCHPHVVEAIRDQAGRLLQSPGRFHSRLALDLAVRLSGLTDSRLTRVFFANSGAESNDGAIKLALKNATVKGKQGYGIVALEHSFHGRLSLPLSLTGNAGRKKGFGPYSSFPGVVHITAPYYYRDPFRSRDEEEFGEICARQLEDAIKTRAPGEVSVMIAEPILAVGGVLIPPKNYWPRVQEICRKNGILLIHDEVFGGFGRTGKVFSHQHWDVQPDIVTFAKAIGGGLPLGGFIASEEVGTAFDDGDHFTTFGSNNQVGLAAGHAVLDVLSNEKLAERSAELGERLTQGLRELQKQFPVIGDVRGKGLMVAAELVKNRESREPAADVAKKVQVEMRKRGIILGITGVYGCVLRMTPPLVINSDQIDEVLASFREVFSKL